MSKRNAEHDIFNRPPAPPSAELCHLVEQVRPVDAKRIMQDFLKQAKKPAHSAFSHVFPPSSDSVHGIAELRIRQWMMRMEMEQRERQRNKITPPEP